MLGNGTDDRVLLVSDTIRRIVQRFGEEILLDNRRFPSMFKDYAPKLEGEVKIISMALSFDIAKLYVRCPEHEREFNIRKSKQVMDGILSDSAIQMLIESFVIALDWDNVQLEGIFQESNERITYDSTHYNRNSYNANGYSGTLDSVGGDRTVSLENVHSIDLTTTFPYINKICVGLGWNVNDYNQDFFLDAEAFMLGKNGKVTNDRDFIFYNNLRHSSGSVEHMGDYLADVWDGDDEKIKINLATVPANIDKIVFSITIHEANEREQNFSQVRDMFIRVVNEIDREELFRYDLEEHFSNETAVVVAEIFRDNGDWKFRVIGRGFRGGLIALCKNFGINV